MTPKLTCEAVARTELGEPLRQQGAELLWRCPNHDDKRPSLSVNPKKDKWLCGPCNASGGAWKLAAFLAGCDPADKQAVKTWLAQHGLSNPARRKARSGGERGPVAMMFVHHDIHGQPVCRKLRHEPGADGKDKDYTWERFEDREWKPGLGNPPIVPPLYRLPDIKSEPLIFLFESHTDVERAVSMGLRGANDKRRG
jgi:hypothetical protein